MFDSSPTIPRRSFLAALAAGSLAARLAAQDAEKPKPQAPASGGDPWFQISLAQWSLHKQFKKGEIDPLDFAIVAAKEHGIRAIEYVNQFYFGRIEAPDYFRKLKQRADDHGVVSLLIMCDAEGLLGAADTKDRKTAVDNHHKWVDGAATLGCHSIRVNAIGEGDSEEQKKRVAEGLNALAQYCNSRNLDLLVENHGGYSSDGAWTAEVIKLANHPRIGTLPDFGNFRRMDGTWADRYEGVKAMMPYAKAVSAKSHEFDDQGNEVRTDYARMLQIVKEAGYRGYVGIEYEGEKHSAADGIKLTKNLLERLRVAGA
jgi:L-ribulose-5-phosphate 3-epimerase